MHRLGGMARSAWAASVSFGWAGLLDAVTVWVLIEMAALLAWHRALLPNLLAGLCRIALDISAPHSPAVPEPAAALLLAAGLAGLAGRAAWRRRSGMPAATGARPR